MQKIRAGVVGIGYLGKFHAEKYASLPHVELAGLVDLDLEKAKSIASSLGVEAWNDYRALFGKVDAVSIVVPTPLHFAVSKDFLQNGIDVLIEKPMTTTLEEAERLIEIAETEGRLIQVGHLERYNPAVMAIEEQIQAPMFIEADRLSIYNERGTDVSVVLDLMIHDIDIISSFVKSKIIHLHAAGMPVISEHVDIANARVEFESGCIANVTASRISNKNERKIRVFQKNAYFSIDFARREISIIEKSEAEEETAALIPGMTSRQLCFPQADALQTEIEAFVNAVRTREKPLVSGEVGRNALKIALTVMKKIRATYQNFENCAARRGPE
jgi:predicted dehydrogenase